MANSTKVTAESIWKILGEVGRLNKETAQLRKKNEEVRKENEEVRKKNEEELKEVRKKTEESFKRLQEAQRKTEESLNKANGNFNDKWGTFMENLIQGDLVKLLTQRNIRVDTVLSQVPLYRPDKSTATEFDLIAINTTELVVVEVKTTLTGGKVDQFIEKLKGFKKSFPDFSNKKVYGMVAHLGDYNDAVKDAQERGLFVVKSPGGVSNISKIINAGDFRPRSF